MLINLRNALMAGKRLPYDAEVEYLESSGTQWIDMGVVATNNTRVKVAFSDYTQAGAWLFGTRRGFKNAALGIYTNSNAENNRWLRAFGNFISSDFIFSTVDLGVSTFDYDCGHFTGTREKVPITVDFTDTASAFDSSPYNIYLWTVNLAGTPGSVSSAKIYATQIWQNGVLVRDFIPVRKGTVGYLYDRVSGKLFGNAGTGDFVLGPDVVPVEWLRTTGSQCVDTGIRATPDSVIRCTLTPISKTYNGMVFYGAGKADGEAGFGDMVELVDQYGNGGHIVFIATGRAANGLGFSYGNTLVTTANCSTGALTVNGTTAITANRLLMGTAQYPLYIGCANVAGTRFRGANCRYHSFAIEQSGTLIGSFYPVRVGTEGAMMDVLTRRIYRNAGTGAFGYGNDLKYPIPAE